MIITKSKILQLKECPLSFKFKYIKKQIPDTKRHHFTDKGLEVHNLFNTFFDHEDLSKIPNKYKDLFLKFYEWNLVFNQINKSYYVSTQKSKQDLTLKEFMNIEWVKKASLNPINDKIIKREHEVRYLDMYGIVDRINYDNIDYTLIDYKSGFYDLSELRFELNFYKHLVDSAKILDKPIKYICSYGYNKGTIFFERVNQKSYDLMLKKVDAFRKLKFKEITYPKKTGFHCQWCEYKLACNKADSQLTFDDIIEGGL